MKKFLHIILIKKNIILNCYKDIFLKTKHEIENTYEIHLEIFSELFLNFLHDAIQNSEINNEYKAELLKKMTPIPLSIGEFRGNYNFYKNLFNNGKTIT